MERRQRRDNEHPGRDDEHPRREEPRSIRDFERALEEEALISTEFDLPLCVIVARARTRVLREAARQVVAVLRAADLVAKPEPTEIAVALPNTEFADAEVVERRLSKTLPGAVTGIAAHRSGDTVQDLLNRARSAVTRKTPDPG